MVMSKSNKQKDLNDAGNGNICLIVFFFVNHKDSVIIYNIFNLNFSC